MLLLTGVEDIKEYLNIPDSDTTSDNLIYEQVRRTSAKIEKFCDRRFNARIYQEYYQGDGTNKLLLKQYPIIAIGQNLGAAGQAPTTAYGEMQDAYGNITNVPSGSPVTLGIWDDVSYVFGANTQKAYSEIIVSNQVPGMIQLAGDIFINSKLWSYYNVENILVVYQAGYATIPDDLKDCAVKVTCLEYMRSKGLLSSVEWEKDPSKMMQEAWDEIAQYRHEM